MSRGASCWGHSVLLARMNGVPVEGHAVNVSGQLIETPPPRLMEALLSAKRVHPDAGAPRHHGSRVRR